MSVSGDIKTDTTVSMTTNMIFGRQALDARGIEQTPKNTHSPKEARSTLPSKPLGDHLTASYNPGKQGTNTSQTTQTASTPDRQECRDSAREGEESRSSLKDLARDMTSPRHEDLSKELSCTKCCKPRSLYQFINVNKPFRLNTLCLCCRMDNQVESLWLDFLEHRPSVDRHNGVEEIIDKVWQDYFAIQEFVFKHYGVSVEVKPESIVRKLTWLKEQQRKATPIEDAVTGVRANLDRNMSPSPGIATLRPDPCGQTTNHPPTAPPPRSRMSGDNVIRTNADSNVISLVSSPEADPHFSLQNRLSDADSAAYESGLSDDDSSNGEPAQDESDDDEFVPDEATQDSNSLQDIDLRGKSRCLKCNLKRHIYQFVTFKAAKDKPTSTICIECRAIRNMHDNSIDIYDKVRVDSYLREQIDKWAGALSKRHDFEVAETEILEILQRVRKDVNLIQRRLRRKGKRGKSRQGHSVLPSSSTDAGGSVEKVSDHETHAPHDSFRSSAEGTSRVHTSQKRDASPDLDPRAPPSKKTKIIKFPIPGNNESTAAKIESGDSRVSEDSSQGKLKPVSPSTIRRSARTEVLHQEPETEVNGSAARHHGAVQNPAGQQLLRLAGDVVARPNAEGSTTVPGNRSIFSPPESIDGRPSTEQMSLSNAGCSSHPSQTGLSSPSQSTSPVVNQGSALVNLDAAQTPHKGRRTRNESSINSATSEENHGTFVLQVGENDHRHPRVVDENALASTIVEDSRNSATPAPFHINDTTTESLKLNSELVPERVDLAGGSGALSTKTEEVNAIPLSYEIEIAPADLAQDPNTQPSTARSPSYLRLEGIESLLQKWQRYVSDVKKFPNHDIDEFLNRVAGVEAKLGSAKVERWVNRRKDFYNEDDSFMLD